MTLSRKQQKTAIIISAATNYFLKFGYNGATTDLIQKEAQVSKATLYNHFPTKESMFIAVVNRQCLKFIEQARKIEIPDEPLEQSLQRIGEAYLTLLLAPDNLALCRAIIAEAPRFPDLAKRFFEAGPASISEELARAIDKALGNQELAVTAFSATQLANDFVCILRAKSQLFHLLHPQIPADKAQISDWVRQTITLLLGHKGDE